MISSVTLDKTLLEERFRHLEEALTEDAILTESERCYYCYDAPCVTACPTKIDIPGFILALVEGQPVRAAERILLANPLGASCSRVCPVENLCEQSCVRVLDSGNPVRIGKLQRRAMQDLSADVYANSFSDESLHDAKVAVIGAGPAGMTAAYLLANAGFEVDVYESQALPGGLNESGIAAYKMLDDAAQWEASRLLSHPQIRLHCGRTLGKEIHLSQLRKDYQAVFMALGLQGQQRLHIPGEDWLGVWSAVPFIARMRRKEPVPVGKRVVVIGGGMTAIDIAVQIRLLGAAEVNICYRRGPEAMGASHKEQQLARDQGVFIHHFMRPLAIEDSAGVCDSIRLQPTKMVGTRLEDVGNPLLWPVDQVFVAIGQQLEMNSWNSDVPDLQLDAFGKIRVDAAFRTSLESVWAGGDCTSRSDDLTVHAVADAKMAVSSIIATLMQHQPTKSSRREVVL